jgi:Flp pilus assembly protein protease CpaA
VFASASWNGIFHGEGSQIFLMILATGILMTGIVEDLRARKVRNTVFLVCLTLSFLAEVTVGLLTHSFATTLLTAFLGFGGAVALSLPFVLFGILGAGDMKLFAAFGLATTWNTVLTVFIASLVWGAVLGLISSLTHGQGKALLRNMVGIFVPAYRVQRAQMHAIPYTVALMFGWVSYLVILKTSGGGL